MITVCLFIGLLISPLYTTGHEWALETIAAAQLPPSLNLNNIDEPLFIQPLMLIERGLANRSLQQLGQTHLKNC